jgi:hypothetical protein
MNDNEIIMTLAKDLEAGRVIDIRTCTSQRPNLITVSTVTPIKGTDRVLVKGVNTETEELEEVEYWGKAEFYR